jgi:hypothetical protein
LACLNALAVAGDYEVNWYADLLGAQVLIAGGWLALGRAPRLARAGVFVAAVVVSVAPDYLLPMMPFAWRHVLGTLIFLGSAAAVGGWICLLALHALGGESIGGMTAWRFSVAELLGWMIVVAVAAVIVPAAAFDHVTSDPKVALLVAAAASVSSFIMALFLRRSPGHDVSSAAMAIVGATAVEVIFSQFDRPTHFLPAYVIVAVWILAQRLDAQRSDAAGPAAAPVRIYDPESDDQRRASG